MSTANPSSRIHKLSISLHSTDRLLIAFWCLLSLVCLIFHFRIPEWRTILAANLAAIVLACALAYLTESVNSKTLRWIHGWVAFPMVVFTYKQIYYMIAPLHQYRDYDAILIWMDRLILRGNPTEWLMGISNPFLTEVLQIAYSLFYVFFVVVGLDLCLKHRDAQFHSFRFTVVYGFLLSYIGYFFLPAAGPRFTLHDFSKMEVELPGLLLTPALRWFVNWAESIPPGASNALALACAQRDVFPSGHTMLTLLAVFLAYKYRLRTRHCLAIVGALLILATVYLRYHYFIDIVAGALLVCPCLLTAKGLHSFFRAVPSKSLADS